MSKGQIAPATAVNDVDLSEIDRIISDIGREERHLIPILQFIQKKYNYLPEQALRRISKNTQISPASVSGVSTFYSQFRKKPAGKHFVRVCIGTACHVKGAQDVFRAFKRHLEIDEDDDTDSNKLFTIEEVACLGCCMLAPAVQIDDLVYGYVTPQTVSSVLTDFLKAQETAVGKDLRLKGGLKVVAEMRICLCSSCLAGGSAKVYEAAQKQISDLNLPVVLKVVGCTGISYQTPHVIIAMRDGRSFSYGLVDERDIRRILLRHVKPVKLKGKISAAVSGLLERLLTDESWTPVTRYCVDVRDGPDAAYCGRQTHIAMERCGDLDPLSFDDYRKNAGFAGLEKCLKEFLPEQVIDEVKESGLRGRGGAGFRTGKKWEFVRAANGKEKIVICNGDEGDPGAFMDRMIMESFPFRVIEGMAIASYAVGAHKGVLYIRAEYPLAIRRMREAIRICMERGYLGGNILESGHTIHLEVVEGAGAFVCGEETALIAALEGKRGMPRIRPPYPAHDGLEHKPTLVNNVETFSCLSWIIRHGANEFRDLGTEKSSGSKTFALAGKIVRGGLVEVPMGITVREIVEEIGGGIEGGNKLKAVQIGGPSGGCVPEELADTPVDYDHLISAGAIMGSGGMVVLDETDCMVDIARYFLSFTQAESCGKCTFCRIGTKRMLEILERLCAGQGRGGDIERLEHLAKVVKEGSLCGLGKTAPNPVLSTLMHFRSEYEAHIAGVCPAMKCKEMIQYVINDDCIGCTKCAQNCPVEAIEFRPYEKHEIDQEKCTRCDTCRKVCPSGAVHKENI